MTNCFPNEEKCINYPPFGSTLCEEIIDCIILLRFNPSWYFAIHTFVFGFGLLGSSCFWFVVFIGCHGYFFQLRFCLEIVLCTIAIRTNLTTMGILI